MYSEPSWDAYKIAFPVCAAPKGLLIVLLFVLAFQEMAEGSGAGLTDLCGRDMTFLPKARILLRGTFNEWCNEDVARA